MSVDSEKKKRAGGKPPRASKPPSVDVGRGPVPRHVSGYRSQRGGQAPALRSPHGIAGDRPPRDCNQPLFRLLHLPKRR